MAPDDVVEMEPDLERSSAVEALYRTHYVAMARTARLLVGNRAEGEEVAQDAFVALYGNGFADKSALIKVDPSGHHTVIWVGGAGAGSPPGATAGLVLGPDDLGIIHAGEAQTVAVATMTRFLGPPSSTAPGTCQGTTEVEWNDLSLEFSGGSFAGYRYLRGGLAAVGATSRPSPGPGTPLLKTAAGVTLGMTLAEVRPLYPPEAFSAEQGGRIAVGGTKTGDRLFLGFFDQAPGTPLSEIKGGSPWGDL
jgi:hypothetical protein